MSVDNVRHAQKGGRRPDGTITVARQCDSLALTSFGSIQGKTLSCKTSGCAEHTALIAADWH